MIVYLAGSIRDGNAQDINWREHAVTVLAPYATVLNPLAGKSFSTVTGKWSLFNKENPDATYIVHADFWAVDRADIILVDLRSLAVGYPSLGTLLELGRSTARLCLRFGIVPPEYTGHTSPRHFSGLHPFLEKNFAKVFHNEYEAVDFVKNVLAATQNPHYTG